MSLNYLEHVNIRTHDVQRMTRFYEDVIGLKDG